MATHKEPLVDICMIAYNHAEFLAEAIEGVVKQKTSFYFRLIISDDCSTDNSAAIIQHYKNKYPNTILVIPNESNLGMMKNFVQTLSSCTSKYIALCEGDDYWTDLDKLQKQVSFLEEHSDYSSSFHNMLRLDQAPLGQLRFTNPKYDRDTFDIFDLAKTSFIFTASCVFRNNFAVSPIPSWFVNAGLGDYPLHMLNAKFGKIKYFPKIMGAYRVHAGGGWEIKPQFYRLSKWFEMQEMLSQEFDGPVLNILKTAQYDTFIKLLESNDDEQHEGLLAEFLQKNAAAAIPFIQRLLADKRHLHDKTQSRPYKAVNTLLSPLR